MTKHAILIGVNTVPGMSYLNTPADYAIKMRKWAISQGYESALFVDDLSTIGATGPCTRTTILYEVHKAIMDGTDQLLIYFSGHGIQRTVGTDIWLLPGYEVDPSDCINLAECKAVALKSGVPHVVFISDSCRAASDKPALQAAIGGSIIPNMERFNPKIKVDMLYSTWPGLQKKQESLC